MKFVFFHLMPYPFLPDDFDESYPSPSLTFPSKYFDRELLEALGHDFPRLVADLGYEPDDTWMREVPHRAPDAFDFSRFRIQRSTTRQKVRACLPSSWSTTWRGLVGGS